MRYDHADNGNNPPDRLRVGEAHNHIKSHEVTSSHRVKYYIDPNAYEHTTRLGNRDEEGRSRET